MTALARYEGAPVSAWSCDDDKFEIVLAAIEDGETTKAAIRLAGTSWYAVNVRLLGDVPSLLRYAQARRSSALFWADKAVEAVNVTDPALAQLSRVQADVYKWRASVADPLWSERHRVEQQVQSEVVVRVVRETVPLPTVRAQVGEGSEGSSSSLGGAESQEAPSLPASDS